MPQQAWSDKEERQYDHVKESELDRGRSQKKAKEIAARTVNKQRRENGKTPIKPLRGPEIRTIRSRTDPRKNFITAQKNSASKVGAK